MGLLQRSKSAAVVERKVASSLPFGDEIKSSSHEQPRTEERAKNSFSRPRTANAAVERTAALQVPPAYRIDVKAGSEIFSFPTPSFGLSTPKSATSQPRFSAIGVAIGSPTQAKPDHKAINDVNEIVPDSDIPPPPTRSPPALPEHPDLENSPLSQFRRKKSGWKTFTGLFGRRAEKTVEEEPFYKLKVSQGHVVPANSNTVPKLSPGPSSMPQQRVSTMPRHHRRTSSESRGQARFEARVGAHRASFQVIGRPNILRSPSTVLRQGFSPMFREFQRAPEDAWIDDPRKDSPLSFHFKSEIPEDPDMPRLDLNLPSPRFERYSVMFEKVLFEDPKPSLLERRQSKLQRNKSVKTLNVNTLGGESSRLEAYAVPQRSATSPHLMRSISIKVGKKLLSPVGEAFSAMHRPRPVHRSKTAPPTAVSPRAEGLSNPRIILQSGSPNSIKKTEISLPPTPMTIATSLLSDTDSVAVIENDLPQMQRSMDEAEPSWDMLTSEPVEDCIVPPLRSKSASAPERNVVRLSMARQVSVGKGMTQVHEAVASSQPLRPKMVELNHKRLTSTVVLIESAHE